MSIKLVYTWCLRLLLGLWMMANHHAVLVDATRIHVAYKVHNSRAFQMAPVIVHLQYVE
jgi:hypothetical protein